MDLHERLKSAQVATAAVDGDGRVDPFAEVKTRVHLAIISELGPQLYNLAGDRDLVHQRIVGEIKDRLAQEAGLSREDRASLAGEIEDDILGYGPIEPYLRDPDVSEVMVNGPDDIWLEKEGRLVEADAV